MLISTIPKESTAIPTNDSDYVSSEDEDFDPSKVQQDDHVSSDSETETLSTSKIPKGKKKPGRKKAGEAEDLGFENSGDEATIRKGKKRKKKGTSKDDGNENSEDGGEGGVVRTRAMRKGKEEKEKKPLASAEGGTINIDALWESMNSPSANIEDRPTHVPSASDDPSNSPETPSGAMQKPSGQHGTKISVDSNRQSRSHPSRESGEEMITIKRTYEYAGEKYTDRKLVPKSSAEAKVYLESLQQSSSSPSQAPPNHPPLRRPKKRVSKYEPNPEGIIKGLPTSSVKSIANRGPKLNVVEKSKLDWAGYVDKEGMKDELAVAEKAKGGYLSRVEFLGRVDAKREEELRDARTK